MAWNFDNNRPIYLQIIDEIKVMIISGKIMPGDQVPAVRDMAHNAGVNPNTMQRALSELEKMGLIYSDRTAGRYVRENSELISELRDAWIKDIANEFCSKFKNISLSEEEIDYITAKLRGENGK